MKTVQSGLVLCNGKATVGVFCLASVVLLAGSGQAAGEDVRKAVRAILPATVAVECRSVDSESARRTEVFPIRHSKADVVAQAVRDVYRDRLSDPDKSPAGKKQLTIGVDAASNRVIVSAPDSLLREIGRLIEQLDSAAKADPKIAVEELPRNWARAWATLRGKGTVVVADQPANRPDAVGLASGTVVSSDGLIVTLLGAAEGGEYSVTFEDGRAMPAKLLVDDQRSGLRLLKVDGKDFAHVELADQEPELGQHVVAVYATDPKSRVVAQGIVAAVGRSLPGLLTAVLQTDVQVRPMSAGAPLAGVDGKLVGVIAAIAAREPTQGGPAYAIPADYVARLLDAREGDQTVVVERGHLGVMIRESSEPGGAPWVGGVGPDTPAAAAGIQENDEIVTIDGQPVSTPAEVVRLIGRHKPGDRVTIVIRRDDKEQELEVTLGRFDRKPQTAASPPPKIEAVEPRSLYLLDADGTRVKRFTIALPDGRIVELPQDGKVPGTLFDPTKQPRYSAVYPAPGTLRVQRSDLEKKLDQLNSDVQTLQEHIQKLTEEVQKLRQGMGRESAGEK